METECAGKPEPGVAHFVRTRFTKPGAHYLLRLCYGATVAREDLERWHTWENLYDRAMYIQRMAAIARVRLPKYLFSLDKAHTRESIAKARRRGDAVTDTMKQAEAWARR